MQEIKNSILKRIYILYFSVLIFSIIIVFQILRIQLTQGKYWKERAKEFAIKSQVVEATKGNIYADDGKALLATSIPIFELRLNASSGLIKDEDFDKTVDALSDSLATLFKDRSYNEYRLLLMKARKDKRRGGYLLLQKNVSYVQVKRVKKFPKFKSGRIAIAIDIKQEDKRVLPYDLLAKRTIGFIGLRDADHKDTVINGKKRRINFREPRKVAVYAGIEGYFSKAMKVLVGEDGKRLVRLAAGGERLPLYNDSSIVEPKNGRDIVTTINVDIQEVAQNSLMENLIKNKAEHGCAILMEVATGEIKAIVNLKRDTIGGKITFSEAYNYAIGEAANPGSTFKLASLMVALEDKVVDTNTRFNTDFSVKKIGAKLVSDAHPIPGMQTVKQIFEKSSNVGTATVIWDKYHDNPQKFIDGLDKLKLRKPMGLDMYGEGYPYIKDLKDPFWRTPYSLPSMAFGYEVELTPLHILTFYNAAANNGRMVRPMFVKEIREMGVTVEKFYPTAISQHICSKETLGKVRSMMEGVVIRGTAKECFKKSLFTIAGKTGTAQINYTSRGVQKMIYRASFVGYFPADKPKYSCIVVITNPSAGAFYGGVVAAPVFKDIADKVYSTLYTNYQADKPLSKKKKIVAVTKVVNYNDLNKVATELKYPIVKPAGTTVYSILKMDTMLSVNNLNTNITGLKSFIAPNVVGMNLKDAIYELERAGFKVRINGKGAVKSQTVVNQREVKLELS